MKLEGNLFPSVEEKGPNVPSVYHPGMTKIEWLYTAAMHGALAAGKDVLEAVAIAQDVLECYGEALPKKKDEYKKR